MSRIGACCFILLALILNLSTGKVFAQIPDIPLPKYEYDTNYVVKYDNLLALRLVSPRRVYDFRLKNTESGEHLGYSPNLQTAIGFGMTYRWLAFDVTMNPKWNRKKTEERGDTREFNVKGMLYLKRNILELFYRRYKGMHINNPDDYLDPWDGLYPYRSDMINQNLSLEYTIPFNSKKYSLRTTFQVDGRLKKSAGTFMYTSGLNIQAMKADSSIVPVEYEYNFDDYGRISSYGFLMLQQSLGYAYTFVYRKFYLTLSALPGLSLALGNVDSEAGKYSANSLNFMFLSRNGLGYNTRRWYAGLYLIYKYQSTELRDNLTLNNNLGEIRFFVGYRIHAPYLVSSVVQE